MQNVIGVGAAWAMGIDPLIGLIAGSVTMSGGHGTGVGVGPEIRRDLRPRGRTRNCSRRSHLWSGDGRPHRRPGRSSPYREAESARSAAPAYPQTEALTHDAAESSSAFAPQRLTVTILLIAAAVALGSAISRPRREPHFHATDVRVDPVRGRLIRNGLALAKLHEIDGEALSFVGTVSLSLFLAMALMSLRLWELAALALPMFAILALQAIGVALFTSLITFRVMGSNYEAAALVAGQWGSGSARHRRRLPTCRPCANRPAATRHRRSSSCLWSEHS